MDTRNTLLRLLTGGAILGSLFVGGIAFAQTSFPQNGGMPPGVVGTVSSISGTTLTVQSMAFGQNTSATTYTVDASSATVTKNNISASLSDISVGDMVMVEGTVSGANIAATSIHDGLGGMMGGSRPANGTNPGTFGTVASISGTTILITSQTPGSSNTTTYTIDASSASVTKNNTSASVSDISVGDIIMVEGTVNGASVVATSIRDNGVAKSQGTRPTNTRTTSSGSVFARTLKQGMSGEDVKALQQFLNSNGFTIATSGTGSSGNETTYFGSGTKKALIRFQNAHAAEILTPNGLTQGSGIFGPSTIKFVNSMQGTSYTP